MGYRFNPMLSIGKVVRDQTPVSKCGSTQFDLQIAEAGLEPARPDGTGF